jgi:WD40 repeat protein
VTLGGHRRHVTAVAFSPEGSLLATASVDGAVLLWDMALLARIHAEPLEGIVERIERETGLVLDGTEARPRPSRRLVWRIDAARREVLLRAGAREGD